MVFVPMITRYSIVMAMRTSARIGMVSSRRTKAWDNAEDILNTLYADADQYESSISAIEAPADDPDGEEDE